MQNKLKHIALNLVTTFMLCTGFFAHVSVHICDTCGHIHQKCHHSCSHEQELSQLEDFFVVDQNKDIAQSLCFCSIFFAIHIPRIKQFTLIEANCILFRISTIILLSKYCSGIISTI